MSNLLLSLLRMHRNLEPTDRTTLLPLPRGEGSGEGNFTPRLMESLLGGEIAHRDHEPRKDAKPAEAGTPNPQFIESA